MPVADRAYLSILQWPDEATEDWCTSTLAACSGLDAFHARLAVRRGLPQVVAPIPADQAARAVLALHDAGVTAFAPSAAAMHALAPGINAKRLIEGDDAAGPDSLIAVEAWRGDGLTFRPSDLFLMVRASVRSSLVRSEPASSGTNTATVTALLGPAAGIAAAAADSLGPGAHRIRTGHTTLTEVIDLHLRDGRRARITGDKFNFDILGPGRRYSDRESMDRLGLLLAERAPKAIVDTSFGNFRCPPEITREHFTSVGPRSVIRASEMPAFEFYSTWIAMVYKAMAPS